MDIIDNRFTINRLLGNEALNRFLFFLPHGSGLGIVIFGCCSSFACLWRRPMVQLSEFYYKFNIFQSRSLISKSGFLNRKSGFWNVEN